MADSPAPVLVETLNDSAVVACIFDVLLVSLAAPEGPDPNLVIYPVDDAESVYSLRFDTPWPWLAAELLTNGEIGYRVTFAANEDEALQVRLTDEGIILDHYQGDAVAGTAAIPYSDLEAALELPPGMFAELLQARDLAGDTPYRCDDCGRVQPRMRTKPARDLLERLDPDGAPTDRECGACGALAYQYELATT